MQLTLTFNFSPCCLATRADSASHSDYVTLVISVVVISVVVDSGVVVANSGASKDGAAALLPLLTHDSIIRIKITR